MILTRQSNIIPVVVIDFSLLTNEQFIVFLEPCLCKWNDRGKTGHALTKAFKYATSAIHILTSQRTHFGDIERGSIQLSGDFAKLRKVTVSYVMS